MAVQLVRIGGRLDGQVLQHGIRVDRGVEVDEERGVRVDASLPVFGACSEDPRKGDGAEPPIDRLLHPEAAVGSGHAGVDGDDVGSIERERLERDENEGVPIGL